MSVTSALGQPYALLWSWMSRIRTPSLTGERSGERGAPAEDVGDLFAVTWAGPAPADHDPPDLEFRAFCTRRRLPASSTPQLERAWDAWQAERYRRGEIGQRPGYTGNPFRPR
jgi:hypothetical protein